MKTRYSRPRSIESPSIALQWANKKNQQCRLVDLNNIGVFTCSNKMHSFKNKCGTYFSVSVYPPIKDVVEREHTELIIGFGNGE